MGVLPIDLYLRQEMTNARFALPIFGIFLLCVITAAIPMDNDDLEDTKLNPNVDPAVAVLEQAHVQEDSVVAMEGIGYGRRRAERQSRKPSRQCARGHYETGCHHVKGGFRTWGRRGEGLTKTTEGRKAHRHFTKICKDQNPRSKLIGSSGKDCNRACWGCSFINACCTDPPPKKQPRGHCGKGEFESGCHYVKGGWLAFRHKKNAKMFAHVFGKKCSKKAGVAGLSVVQVNGRAKAKDCGKACWGCSFINVCCKK